MSEAREEYTRENYPSFGKKYNSERAIISLTSWTARINTVSKTLYSLLTQCKGFHIVLVLSEEEFPKMMDELPENLKLFVENKLIEVLWVFRNYKAMKKVIFTMQKYPEVPIISADDDCVYDCNYAQELYDKWNKNKECLIRYKNFKNWHGLQGPCSLYFPHFYNLTKNYISQIENFLTNDDNFFRQIINNNDIKILSVTDKDPYHFHTKEGALNPEQYI